MSGLAAAYRLSQSSPPVQVTLLEAADRLGGKIATEHVDGFVIEAGPDSFLSAKARGVGLSVELGLGERLRGVTPQQKRAFILVGGRLHDLPEGLTGLVPTRLAPLARSSLLTPRGKVRVALDYLLPPRRDPADESLGSFIRRRLGDEAWERLVEPLMAGIYAADGDTLSLAATFPQLRDAEQKHGGLIRGVLAARRAALPAATPAKSAFLTPAGGLGEMVTTLASTLRQQGVAIRTGAAVTGLSRAGSGYKVHLASGERIAADAVIVAAPAYAAAEILAGLDGELTADLAAIPHASTAIVSLGYRREEIPYPLSGHGYVVPRIEGGPILACTWSSRKWAGRAPEGCELLRVFVGRAGAIQEELPAMSDEHLLALARQEVGQRLGITAAPLLSRVQRWPRGMPQYILGHPERVARIEKAARHQPGLYLAGNAYRGVGLPDCIASGERAADAALARLEARLSNTLGAELMTAPMP